MKTKKIAATIMTMAMAAMTTIPAFAGTYIRGTGDKMYFYGYIKDDGTRATNGWYWIDRDGDGVEECYYFDQDGWNIPGWKKTPDGYNVNTFGAWTVDGVVQTRGTATVDLTKAATLVGTYVGTGDYNDQIVVTITDNGDGGVRFNGGQGVYYFAEKNDRGYVWSYESEEEKDSFVAGANQIDLGYEKPFLKQ